MTRFAAVVAIAMLAGGCSGIPSALTAGDAGGESGPPDLLPPPTYTIVFDSLFAVGTPGHCAKAGCHGDPGHHDWLCGSDKQSCYQGLLKVGLVDPKDPTHSLIADPANSPLRWINRNGPMPFDDPSPNVEGGAIIEAWVAAGARDD